MNTLQHRLTQARHRLVEQLAGIGIHPVVLPRGGFYLWCRLPKHCSATTLARRCLQQGVILAPGNVFSVSQSADRFLRFNVAQSADERILSLISDMLDTH